MRLRLSIGFWHRRSGLLTSSRMALPPLVKLSPEAFLNELI
jgi:hypothetical protein